MGKREVLGLCACPECGDADAEIRRQGSGLLYRYCFECGAQYFARNPAASDRLEKTIARPVAVADSQSAEEKPASQPASQPKKAARTASQPASQPAEETPPAGRPEVTRTARPGLSLFGRGAS